MKEENKLIILTEFWSMIAMVLIFFKVLLLEPACFSVEDNYFTILPLIITKILELKLVFRR